MPDDCTAKWGKRVPGHFMSKYAVLGYVVLGYAVQSHGTVQVNVSLGASMRFPLANYSSAFDFNLVHALPNRGATRCNVIIFKLIASLLPLPLCIRPQVSSGCLQITRVLTVGKCQGVPTAVSAPA